jgi:acyl-CoA synthetase (AMP-forming)/AMP-acid ligase II
MNGLYDPRGLRSALVRRWYEEGYYSTQTFPQAMAEGHRNYSNRGIVFYSEGGGTRVLTADELYTRARALAGALHRLGIRAGDVVAIQVPNWVEGNLMFQATMLLGAVVLPIIHIYGAAEVSYILRQSGAKLLIVPDRWRNIDYLARLAEIERPPTLRHVLVIGDAPAGCLGWQALLDTATHDYPEPELHPDDVALMVFTSGTTSDPKGVLHSHNSLLAELRAGWTRTGDGDETRAVVLSPWPAGHIAGVLGILRLYFSGAESVLMDAWNADAAARLVVEYRVTSSSGTPYFINSLLDAAAAGGHDISTLATYMVGAANVPPETVERCERLGIVTYRSYGSSEHPTISGGEPSQPVDKRANTDGTLRPGVAVRIVDDHGEEVPMGTDGEILSIGPEQFVGYQQAAFNADAFDEQGWFRTGDIGRLDEEGYLTITDRKKDIIIRGGENIASKEVEDLLVTLAAVQEVAVTAMPDERLGEKVCAFVVLKRGARLTLDDVRAHFVSLKVARQKTPERLEIVADLPRTASGKVKKFELRDRLRTGQSVS